jgi:hypothetical protein
MNTSADALELDAESFFAKWSQSWPAAQAARLYASPQEWPLLRARAGTLFEIAECCWILRDPTVREHKLAWWHDELQLHAQGKARHPLLAAAPTIRLSTRIAEHALAVLHEAPPSTASQSLTRILRLADNAADPLAAVACSHALLVALFLLALREGQPSAFAQAPLDLRARHAVASADSGVALDALVATLAHAWRDELRSRYATLPRADWHGARGLRVLNQQALSLIEALAAGRAAPEPGWRTAVSAWWAVTGLR